MESTAASDREPPGGHHLYRRPDASPPAAEPGTPVPPNWPSISDYWPDRPHRADPTAPPAGTGPQAPPLRTGPPAPPPPVAVASGAGRVRRGRRALFAAAAVLAAALIGGAGFAAVRSDRAEPPAAAPPAAAPQSDPADPALAIPVPVAPKPSATPEATPSAPATASAPARGLTEATFDLVSDVTAINLRTADLGGDLYRISAPTGSSVRPRVAVSGSRVALSLVRNGRRGTAAVDVVLAGDVRWNLRVSGGVKTGALDLGDARLAAVDLRGGATRIDLTLPPPDGTFTVRMSGGINQFRVFTADRVPARVVAKRGAGKVTLFGRVQDGVARGGSVTTPDFDGSDDRIQIDAVAGMGTLQLDDA